MKQFVDGEDSFKDFWTSGGDDMDQIVLDPKRFASAFSLLTKLNVTIHVLERKNFSTDELFVGQMVRDSFLCGI